MPNACDLAEDGERNAAFALLREGCALFKANAFRAAAHDPLHEEYRIGSVGALPGAGEIRRGCEEVLRMSDFAFDFCESTPEERAFSRAVFLAFVVAFAPILWAVLGALRLYHFVRRKVKGFQRTNLR